MTFILSGHSIDPQLTPVFRKPSQFSQSPLTLPLGSGSNFGGNSKTVHAVTNASTEFAIQHNGTVNAVKNGGNGTGSHQGLWFNTFGPTTTQIVNVGDWHESPAVDIGADFEAMAVVESLEQIQFASNITVFRGTNAVAQGTWQSLSQATLSNIGFRARLSGNSAQGGGTVIASALVRYSIREAATQQVKASAIFQYELNT